MADKWQLQDGSGSWRLQDDSGYWILQQDAASAPPIIPTLFSMPPRASGRDSGEIAAARYRAQEAPHRPQLFGMPAVAWKAVPALVAANLLLTTLATAPKPVQARTFDLPAKTAFQPGFAPPNLLLSTLANVPQAPFTARTGDVQRAIQQQIGFAPPNITAGTLSLPVAPVVPRIFDLPKVGQSGPGFAPPNLLTTTLAAQQAELPFSKTDWPLPYRTQVDVGEIFSRTQPQFPQDPAESRIFDLPRQGRVTPGFDPPNLLESTLAEVATQPPVIPSLFGLPQYKQQIRVSTIFRPEPEDQLYPGQPELFALPPQTWKAVRFDPPNLLESTLSAPVAPVAPGLFPLPYAVRVKVDFVPPNFLTNIPEPVVPGVPAAQYVGFYVNVNRLMNR